PNARRRARARDPEGAPEPPAAARQRRGRCTGNREPAGALPRVVASQHAAGERDHALTCLGRAEDLEMRAEPEEPPGSVVRIGETEPQMHPTLGIVGLERLGGSRCLAPDLLVERIEEGGVDADVDLEP